MEVCDLSAKTDLIVLVHNLSHKIPCYNDSNPSKKQQPALSFLLDEAKSLGIPWVLAITAITNKFSMSAHQQKSAINAVLKAYQASRSTTEVVNSCPYVTPTVAGGAPSLGVVDEDSDGGIDAQKSYICSFIYGLMEFPEENCCSPSRGGCCSLSTCPPCASNHEETAMQESVRDRLVLEAREHGVSTDSNRDGLAKEKS